MNILIQIGNSDDKLRQARWALFIADMRDLLNDYQESYAADGFQIHGEWFSAPDKPWQNANWCVQCDSGAVRQTLKGQLIELRAKYGQESIAWTVGEVEFI